jgi:hypothetical protein
MFIAFRPFANRHALEEKAMSRYKSEQGTTTPIAKLHVRFGVVTLLVLMPGMLGQFTSAQEPKPAPAVNPAPLTAEQVVQNLVQMNRYRAEALHSYQSTRAYRAEYRGLPSNRAAQMAVSVKYVSGKKQFVIESSSGSGLIIDKVLKKLLEAEAEATDVDSQRQSALTDDNYRFTLIGYERGSPEGTYVLRVEPRTDGKFLYRGRIWVDEKDFAVVRLEAEPAKNPSFWTRKTEIVQQYKKVGNFWLPAYNHSSTAIRFGGHAELTIDYNEYEITSASQVSSLSRRPSTLHLEACAQKESQLSSVVEPN